MEKILAINSGSSTLKWKLYEMPDGTQSASGMIDRLGLSDSIFEAKWGDNKTEFKKDVPDHQSAVDLLMDQLIELGIISDLKEINGVGHRVVAGGSEFTDSVVVDDDVLKKIEDLSEFAPLHNPGEAKGIRAFMKALPGVIEVAVFDTSFHTTMDPVNYLYSTPYDWYEKYGVRKFGAHGTSHKYISNEAANYLNKDIKDLKMITLHLGNGASLAAIDGGKSVDTSMGFTPLAGITMSSRSGDIDASLVTYMMNKLDKTPDEMTDILNKESGLLGISGVSSDMRDIQDARDNEGNERAKLAMDIYINRINKYVGSYIALLQGVDVMIFSAGVGENEAEVRERVLKNFEYAGVKLDEDANNNVPRGASEPTIITKNDSSVIGMVVPTNEELMIVKDVVKLKGK